MFDARHVVGDSQFVMHSRCVCVPYNSTELMQRQNVAVYTCAARVSAGQKMSSAVFSADKWRTAFDYVMLPNNPTIA